MGEATELPLWSGPPFRSPHAERQWLLQEKVQLVNGKRMYSRIRTELERACEDECV